MRGIIIARAGGFTLTSYGNGTSYALETETESVYLQGDDAGRFRDELNQLETMCPDKYTGDILAWLWDQGGYGQAAERKTDTLTAE